MIGLAMMRGVNGVVGRVAPTWAARRARHLFTHPRRSPSRPWEAEVEAGATRRPLTVGWSTLRWSCEAPRGRVLCMHGWEGRATQFGALAKRLVERGFEVVALDGPGHGGSPEEAAHPVAFARALLDADRELGPFSAAVGHSMGAGALVIALHWGLRADRAVLLASPSSMRGVLGRFGDFIGLPRTACAALIDEMASHVGFGPDQLDIHLLAARRSEPVLVVHDRDDVEVPATDGRTIAAAWPNATWREVTGPGHRGLLRDPTILDEVADFARGAAG